MIVSAIALLLPAPLLATSPAQGQIAVSPAISGVVEGVHEADEQGQSAQTAGLSVQRICKTGAPSIFSGRARRESCELAVVQPRCKSRAPAMFSGRARTSDCEVELGRPEVATYAPSIFSGRKRPVASAYAAPQYSYVVAADGTATPQVTVQPREEVAKTRPQRRLPSMFTGRRPKPRAPAPAQ